MACDFEESFGTQK